MKKMAQKAKPSKDKLDWVIVPNPTEVVKVQAIKGNTTRSVGWSVVYPDGGTGYAIIGRVDRENWQPYEQIKEIRIIWR